MIRRTVSPMGAKLLDRRLVALSGAAILVISGSAARASTGEVAVTPTKSTITVRSAPAKVTWKVTGLNPGSVDPCWVDMKSPDGHLVGDFVYLKKQRRSERGVTTLRGPELKRYGSGAYEIQLNCGVFGDTTEVRLKVKL